MKPIRFSLLSGILALALASCNLGMSAPQSNDSMATAAAQTVQAVLTASANPTATFTPIPNQPLPSATPTSSESCQQLTQITSWTRDGVTYDAKEIENKLAPGKGFVMSLIVQNTGTCVWTDAYKLKFNDGARLTEQDTLPVMPFGYTVHPGEALTITVQMIAPKEAGDYDSSFSLTDEKGNNIFNFGVKTKVGSATPGSLSAPGELRYAYDCSTGTVNITLTWLDKANGEEGYRIYRDGEKLADLPANSTTYEDVAPASGTYRYTVATFDASGESPISVNAQTTNCQ